MAKIKFKKRINWKGVISAVLCVFVVLGAIAGITAITKNDTKTISSLAFSKGDLDDNGKYVSSETSLYNKDSFECVGLRVSPDFEFNGTYDVYYFDRDDRFVSSKMGLTGVYDEDYPLADRCRIVIHPSVPKDVKEKDFKINFWEVNAYASKLTISVDKKQYDLYGERVNLYVEANAEIGKTFDADGWNSILTVTDEARMKVSEDIAVTGEFEKYDVYVRYSESSEAYAHAVVVAGADNKILERKAFNLNDLEAGEWCKMTIEIPNDYEGDMYLKLRMHATAECYVFGYND